MSPPAYCGLVTQRQTIFDAIVPDAEAAADARAEADVSAGRLISHNAVKRWISYWSTGKLVPRPGIGD